MPLTPISDDIQLDDTGQTSQSSGLTPIQDGVKLDASPEGIAATAQALSPHTLGQKFMHGMGDTGLGILEDVAHYPPISPYLIPGAPPVAVPANAGDAVSSFIGNREKTWQANRTANNDTGMEWARMAGQSTAAAPAMAMLPNGAPGFIGGALSGMGQGATAAIMQPVGDAQGGYGKTKLNQILSGAGLGGLFGGTLGALGGGAKPGTQQSQHLDSVNYLRDRGVEPTVGQSVGSGTATLEDAAGSFNPGVSFGQRRAINQFNVATANSVLEPLKNAAVVGGNISPELGVIAGSPGRDMAAQVYQKISDAYDAVLPKLTFQPDSQLGTDISGIRANLQTYAPDKLKQFDNVLTANNKIFAGGNTLTGEQYKALEEQLGKVASKYAGSQGDEGVYGEALQSTLSAIKANLQRSNPQVPELPAVNQAFSRYASYIKAVGSGDVDGRFTPAQLLRAIKSNDLSARDYVTAQGQGGPLQDLALHGQRVLGNYYPDSGTAGRSAMAHGVEALAAGSLVNPAVPIALGAANLAYTPAAQRLIGGAITSGANLSRQVNPAVGSVARVIQQISPYLAPGLLGAVNGP